MALAKGPQGLPLNFKSAQQMNADVVCFNNYLIKLLITSPVQIADLGQTISNFANIIPKGIIVFFPSYNFLNRAKETWDKSNLLAKIGIKKKVCHCYYDFTLHIMIVRSFLSLLKQFTWKKFYMSMDL